MGGTTTFHHPIFSFSVLQTLCRAAYCGSSSKPFRGYLIPTLTLDSVQSHTYDARSTRRSFVHPSLLLNQHGLCPHAYIAGTHGYPSLELGALAYPIHPTCRTYASVLLSCTLPSYPTPIPTDYHSGNFVWSISGLTFSLSIPLEKAPSIYDDASFFSSIYFLRFTNSGGDYFILYKLNKFFSWIKMYALRPSCINS